MENIELRLKIFSSSNYKYSSNLFLELCLISLFFSTLWSLSMASACEQISSLVFFDLFLTACFFLALTSLEQLSSFILHYFLYFMPVKHVTNISSIFFQKFPSKKTKKKNLNFVPIGQIKNMRIENLIQ